MVRGQAQTNQKKENVEMTTWQQDDLQSLHGREPEACVTRHDGAYQETMGGKEKEEK